MQVRRLLLSVPHPQDHSVGASSHRQDTQTCSPGARGSRSWAKCPRVRPGQDIYIDYVQVSSVSQVWACEGLAGGEGRTSVDAEDISGCLCASRAFWMRQTLEAFRTYAVKNAFQKNVYYTRQKTTTGLWLEHDPVSTWMGPSVRSKHDG